MLVKLKKFISSPSDQIQHSLQKYGLNNTHRPLMLQPLFNLFIELSTQKKYKLADQLLKGISSENWVWQIKCYMIIHYFIIKSRAEYLQDQLILKQSPQIEETNNGKQNIKQYIQIHIVKPYHNYLIKLCLNPQIHDPYEKTDQIKNLGSSFIEEINKRFGCLNLMREIMQLQICFNRMGRYYPEYTIIFDLFKLYLKDVRIYYSQVKIAMTYIFDSFIYLNDEEITHGFYFINEALLNSDKQYEFFYNRYFYEKMKSFDFPDIYKLDYSKYDKLIKNLHKRKIFIDHKPYKKTKKLSAKEFNKTYANETYGTSETIQDHWQTLGNYQENEYDEVVDNNIICDL